MLSASDLLNLGGPAGGSAPGKVLRLQEGTSYDSESLSALKSNRVYRQIAFFELTDYLTRRACLALRVIRFAGKSCFNWAVKKV